MTSLISWTCWPCDGRVVLADNACPGCGATYQPKPEYPFCCHPEKCIAAGRCDRRVGGELHCCAD